MSLERLSVQSSRADSHSSRMSVESIMKTGSVEEMDIVDDPVFPDWRQYFSQPVPQPRYKEWAGGVIDLQYGEEAMRTRHVPGIMSEEEAEFRRWYYTHPGRRPQNVHGASHGDDYGADLKIIELVDDPFLLH